VYRRCMRSDLDHTFLSLNGTTLMYHGWLFPYIQRFRAKILTPERLLLSHLDLLSTGFRSITPMVYHFNLVYLFGQSFQILMYLSVIIGDLLVVCGGMIEVQFVVMCYRLDLIDQFLYGRHLNFDFCTRPKNFNNLKTNGATMRVV